jgi:hypothetical protein
MGNMQVLVNILDLGANMQAPGEMARFTHAQVANTLQLETQLFNLVGQQLINMGHKASAAGGGPMTSCTGASDTCGVSGFYRAASQLPRGRHLDRPVARVLRWVALPGTTDGPRRGNCHRRAEICAQGYCGDPIQALRRL